MADKTPPAGEAKPEKAKEARPKEAPKPKERVRKSVLEKLQRVPRRKGEFTYRGYSLEQLQAMDLEALAEVLPAQARRKLSRGLSADEKRLLEKVQGTPPGDAPAGSASQSAHPTGGAEVRPGSGQPPGASRGDAPAGSPPVPPGASRGDAPAGSPPVPPGASRGDAPVLKTHLRRMVVLPTMVGKEIQIHDGKAFQKIAIMPEMIGHYLGELALTRRRVRHGAAGIGATRSSKFIPLK